MYLALLPQSFRVKELRNQSKIWQEDIVCCNPYHDKARNFSKNGKSQNQFVYMYYIQLSCGRAMSPCVRFKLSTNHHILLSVFSKAEVTWQTSGDQSEITNWIISIWMLLFGSTYPCSWSISFQQLCAVLWATLEKCHKFMKNFEGA